MSMDPQKRQELLAARKADKEKKAKDKARKTLKKYGTGKNKGQAASTIKSAKNMIESATPWGVFALIFQINIFSDLPYALALVAAVLKDILDMSEATGIGYVAVIIFTFLCGVWIAMMMLLAGGGKGRRQQKIIHSWLVLLAGTTAEMIFGLDILPIETFTVIIVCALALLDRKQAAKEEALARKSQEAYPQEAYA